MPEELAFLNDTKYVKHRCKEDDPECVEGWTGGDFEEWAPEESMFNANGAYGTVPPEVVKNPIPEIIKKPKDKKRKKKKKKRRKRSQRLREGQRWSLQ